MNMLQIYEYSAALSCQISIWAYIIHISYMSNQSFSVGIDKFRWRQSSFIKLQNMEDQNGYQLLKYHQFNC